MRASEVVLIKVGGGEFADSGAGFGTVAPWAGVARGPEHPAIAKERAGARKSRKPVRNRVFEFRRSDAGITEVSGRDLGTGYWQRKLGTDCKIQRSGLRRIIVGSSLAGWRRIPDLRSRAVGIGSMRQQIPDGVRKASTAATPTTATS